MLLTLSGEPLEQRANVNDQRRLRAVLVDDTFSEVAGTLTLSAQLRPYRPFGTYNNWSSKVRLTSTKPPTSLYRNTVP